MYSIRGRITIFFYSSDFLERRKGKTRSDWADFGLLKMKGLAPLDSGVLHLFTDQKWEQLSETCFYTPKAYIEYLEANYLQTPSLHFT